MSRRSFDCAQDDRTLDAKYFATQYFTRTDGLMVRQVIYYLSIVNYSLLIIKF